MTASTPVHFRIVRAIDRFTDATGRLVSLSMLFLVLSITYECFSRYLFDSPTIWVFETSYLTNGSAFMLGCAYALKQGAHVRTDIFWEQYSERKKGIIDLASYLLLFYPALITLLVISVDDAWYAYQVHEMSDQTPWRPILWPFRAVIPLTALLLMVQGVSECIKCWHQVRTGREFKHHEKIEV